VGILTGNRTTELSPKLSVQLLSTLNLLDTTSSFAFVFVDLKTVFHSSCTFMISLYIKFHMLGFSSSFVIAMKPNVKENICLVVVLHYEKYYHNKSCILCTLILYHLRTLNYLVLPPDEFVRPWCWC